MDIKQSLKSYGLNDKEALFYLAATKTGEAPLSKIAKEAKIKRSSAYLIEKSLEEKGLMGSFRMRSGLRFVASPPSVLAQNLKRRMEEISEVIPELNALTADAKLKPRVTVYEGRSGYFTIAEDALAIPNETQYHIGSLKKIHEIITAEWDFEHYVPTRLKNNIKLKALYFYEDIKDSVKRGLILNKERDTKELREVRILPADYYYPTSMLIYRNTVVFFASKKEFIAIKIESEELARSEKNKFNLIWNSMGEF